VRSGRGFTYRGPAGLTVHESALLQRIRALAIPPAWTAVWICADPCGHIQAHGRDARGRKQYRYHPQFRAQQDAFKFERLAAFGRALPAIRRRVEQDLAVPGITREKVIAAVVRLLDTTALRVGNPEYARSNKSFGLTTLRDRHVTVDGSTLRFRFRGKAGRVFETGVRDRRLARVVARCQELPGQELFQYLDADGEPRQIGSADVNEYLRETAKAPISAKDFRTWAGTLLAFRILRNEATTDRTPPRRTLRASFELVAEALGNTPAVTRSSYVAPTVVEAFVEGELPRGNGSRRRPEPESREEELELIRLLESRTGVGGAGAGAASSGRGPLIDGATVERG
jgi:DNA topoisomerase-1